MIVQETPIENTLKPDTQPGNLIFRHWPAFARFIRENHMEEYAGELLTLSREADLPIMKLITHLPEEQLLALTIQGHGEFLEKVINNQLKEHLEEGLRKWKENQLEIISKEEIATEDITIGTFIRKKAMMKLLPLYTSDPYEILDIVREIDIFDTESLTVSTKLHFDILKGKIQEQLFFIEKISDTTPGLTYVYDIEKSQLKYANNHYLDYFGYTLDDVQGLGEEFTRITVHPDDIQKGKEVMMLLPQMSNTDTVTMENRMKNSKGEYRWMRHYFSIFKRNEQGNAQEVVGIALDIEHEKRSSDQLAAREEQLLEAQAIGEIGSFEWVFGNKEKTTVTPQLLKIFGLDNVLDFDSFMDYVHPTDRQRLQQEIDRATKQNGIYECEYRYEKNNVEKIIWSRGVVIFHDGAPYSMKGTIMDVTERTHMIHRLQRSEELYKQAQALSNMGNYAYDILHNRITWTDEIYRIFGLEPQSEEIDLERFNSFVHPEDKAFTAQKIAESIEKKQKHNFQYRILLADGTLKIIQAIGEVLVDNNGTVYKFLGTAQDVTEKQMLINNLQQAQSMALIGNWTWDLATNEIEWSDEVFRIYGLEPREGKLSREDYMYLRHPEDAAIGDAAIEKLKETLQPQEYYLRVILHTGEIKNIHVKAEARVNTEGKAVSLIGTLQDITEKQQIITRLQNSEALYKQAEAMSHIGNWSWDLSTKEVTWSDEIFRIYDVPMTENGKIDWDFGSSFRHPDDNQLVTEKINAAITTKEQQEYQYRIITKAGKIKILQGIIEPMTDSSQRVVKVIGTIQDVTEQVLTEQQIKANEAFITKIADTAPSIITTYNINTGIYNFVSEGITKLLGYTPEEVLQEGVSFFMNRLHPEDIEALTEKNNNAVNTANENETLPVIEEFKYRIKDAQGKYRWLHTYGTVFDRNPVGKVEHVLNVSVDITEQVEAELELQQKNMELQISNSSLQDYAYIASHDLKEPLRKITTFSSILLNTQKEQLSTEGQNYLNKITDSALRMQTMINDLLTISTISGNKAFETYSIKKTLEEAIQPLEHTIENKHAIINTGDLPEARIVPAQFRQLFQNLVNNSLKFAREGVIPEINITASYLRPSETEGLEVAKATRYLKIEFSDNGIGFDNAYAEKIFSIFQRLHGQNKYEGTGIGLAICRKVAENHGGTIFANAEQGKGTKFTIIIPT